MTNRSLIRHFVLVIALLVRTGNSAFCQESENPNSQSPIKSWRVHQRMSDESQFKNLRWKALGPKFAGGRIESIDSPRGDLSTLYVGVGSGGVWKSVNGGLTWKHIFRKESSFAIGDLTIAPSDPNTIWVGTGECHVGGMSYAGTGVFKSVDGGKTWTNMGLHNSFHIGQIAVDPQVKNRVYIAAMGQRRRGGQRGIFKTTDGGRTFRRVLYKGDRVSFVDLVIDPSDSSRLYATAWDRGNKSKSGIYRSDDFGENWNRLHVGLPTENIGRVAVAVSASRPGIVYALIVDQSSPNLAKRKPASNLFRSTDFGRSWSKTHSGVVPTYIGWDFCDVRVAPDDANRVYIGGLRLITSNDGGKTFLGEGGLAHNTNNENVFRLHSHQGKGVHLDVHDIWIDPEHPEHMILGNDGGLFSSWDRGKTWLHHNNLPIAEIYRIHLDNQTPFRIWAGSQDNASFVGPSTAKLVQGEDDQWRHVFLDPWSGGDGFSTFPDPNDSKTIFYTQQNGHLKRTVAGKLRVSKRIQPKNQKGLPKLRWAWDTPFFASKHPGETVLYCAAQRVMRSIDLGDSWNVISPSFGNNGLLAMDESILDKKRLVVGDRQGNVFLTKNGGQDWIKSNSLPKKAISSITCSNHNSDRVYVVLSGRHQNDFTPYIYVTADFGKSWKSISGNLPNESSNTIAEDPKKDGLIFVGTNRGVYVSTNGGKAWESLCHSLPTASVVDVKIQKREGILVAATHGLSLFSLDIKPIRNTTSKK